MVASIDWQIESFESRPESLVCNGLRPEIFRLSREMRLCKTHQVVRDKAFHWKSQLHMEKCDDRGSRSRK